MLYVRYFCHGSQSENTETYAPWDCSTLRMSNNHRGVVIIYYYVFAFLGNGEFLIVADGSSYLAHRSKKGWKKGNVRYITYPCRRIRHSGRTYGPFWRHHDIFPNPIKNSDDLLEERIILVLRLKQEKSVLTSLYLYKDGNWRNNNNYNIRSFKVVLLSPLLPLVQYLVINQLISCSFRDRRKNTQDMVSVIGQS